MEDVKKNAEELAKKAAAADKSEDAMRFSQAALNVAHVYATWHAADVTKQ